MKEHWKYKSELTEHYAIQDLKLCLCLFSFRVQHNTLFQNLYTHHVLC